jgi:hypothetical protein
MSEDTAHDQLKAELEALERARRVLAGRSEKWYRSPYIVVWLTVLALVVLELTGVEISFETEIVFILAAVLGCVESQMGVAKKRIDKIVELTGAEKMLQEKYQSNIRLITE